MKVDIVFQTWLRTEERLECFERSFSALCSKLCYDWKTTEIKYYAVSESKRIPEDLRNRFETFCAIRSINIVWKESDPSLSSSLNLCQKTGDAPWLIFLQDDFELQEPLDIMPILHHLESHDNDYVVMLSWKDKFEGFAKPSDTDGLLYLDPKQKTYYFCDWPNFRRRSYLDILGEWKDSMVTDGNGNVWDNGKSENSQNYKAKQLADKCKVLVTDKAYFKHTGGGITVLTEKRYDKVKYKGVNEL